MDAFNATVSGFDSRFATMDGIVKNKVDEGLSNGRAWLGEQASLITGIKQEHKEALTDMLIAAGGLPEGLGKARKYVNSVGKRDPFTSQPQTAAGRPTGLGESAKVGGLEPNAMSESGAPVARDVPESGGGGGGTVAELPESGGTVANLPEGVVLLQRHEPPLLRDRAQSEIGLKQILRATRTTMKRRRVLARVGSFRAVHKAVITRPRLRLLQRQQNRSCFQNTLKDLERGFSGLVSMQALSILTPFAAPAALCAWA